MTLSSLGRRPVGTARSRSDVRGASPAAHRGFQIGPRIRVGGTLGKLGQDVKIGAGKLASNKFVQMGAGALLGPGASAGLAGLGRVLDTSGGGIHGVGGVFDVAKNAALGYGMGKLGGLAKTGIVKAGQSLLNRGGSGGSADGSVGYNGGADGDPTATADGGEGWFDRLKGGVEHLGSQLFGGGAGLIKGAGSALFGGDGGGGLGLGGLAKGGLLAGAVAQAAADREKQAGFMDNAAKYATGSYDERAPLRAQALETLTGDRKAPDLSHIFSNPGNVYDRQRRGLPPLMSKPSAASQLTAGNALSQQLGNRVPMSPVSPVAAVTTTLA